MKELRILLKRKNGRPSWKFTPHPMYHRFCHITRNDTIYGIMMDEGAEYKQIWIGCRIEGKWVTWENELKAETLVFPGGGQYHFPVW